jgi:glycosyltransferase involved in cell wall biosynthesis
VLASRGETFGVVYIEALAAGVPVIGTKCGGPEDFVSEDMGLLVEVDNVEALTGAMQHMIEHSGEYDRELIKRKIKDSFSPQTVARELEIFQDGLEKRKNWRYIKTERGQAVL